MPFIPFRYEPHLASYISDRTIVKGYGKVADQLLLPLSHCKLQKIFYTDGLNQFLIKIYKSIYPPGLTMYSDALLDNTGLIDALVFDMVLFNWCSTLLECYN